MRKFCRLSGKCRLFWSELPLSGGAFISLCRGWLRAGINPARTRICQLWFSHFSLLSVFRISKIHILQFLDHIWASPEVCSGRWWGGWRGGGWGGWRGVGDSRAGDSQWPASVTVSAGIRPSAGLVYFYILISYQSQPPPSPASTPITILPLLYPFCTSAYQLNRKVLEFFQSSMNFS